VVATATSQRAGRWPIRPANGLRPTTVERSAEPTPSSAPVRRRRGQQVRRNRHQADPDLTATTAAGGLRRGRHRERSARRRARHVTPASRHPGASSTSAPVAMTDRRTRRRPRAPDRSEGPE
jgi:hypothetical protein